MWWGTTRSACGLCDLPLARRPCHATELDRALLQLLFRASEKVEQRIERQCRVETGIGHFCMGGMQMAEMQRGFVVALDIEVGTTFVEVGTWLT